MGLGGFALAVRQSLASVPGATVLTLYGVFGIEAAARKPLRPALVFRAIKVVDSPLASMRVGEVPNLQRLILKS